MFELTNVILFMLAYFCVFYSISRITQNYGLTKEGYIVANREAGLAESTLGLVGCWITGLGVLASAQQFYINGWVAYFWFTVPQIFGMILFAWITLRINEKIPNGFTTSEWIRDTYGISVGTIFQIVFIFASFGNLATTFTAMFKYIKFIDIGNAGLLTGLLVAGTALYSFRGGIKTSLLTGSIQTLLNIIIVGVLIYLGMDLIADKTVSDFLTGKNKIADLFEPNLFITFSYVAALTFLTGPLMSAAHHQKSYAQQNKMPWKAWAWGTPGLVLLQTMAAFFGVQALAWGGSVADPTISQMFFFKAIGTTAIALFGIVLLNISCVIIDAHANAIASIIANDFVKNKERSVMVARWSMVGIAFVVWLIALQNFDLTYIFFTYGVLRVNLFIILIMILTTDLLTGRGIFWSAIIMCPVTVYIGLIGVIDKQPMFNVTAVSLAMFVTPIIAYFLSKTLVQKS